MASIGKKNVTILLAMIIATLSIALLDFENLDWDNNKNSYIGFVIMLILVLTSFFFKAEQTEENE